MTIQVLFENNIDVSRTVGLVKKSVETSEKRHLCPIREHDHLTLSNKLLKKMSVIA